MSNIVQMLRAFVLYGLTAIAGALIQDCDPQSVFRPTSLALYPDPPIRGEPVAMTVVFENPGPEVTAGTVTTAITLNGFPLSPSVKALCDDTACPIVSGRNDRSTQSVWPDSVTGKIASKIAWAGKNGESLLCIQTKVAVSTYGNTTLALVDRSSVFEDKHKPTPPAPHHSDGPKPAPAPAPHHSDGPKPTPAPAPHHSDKPKPVPHHSDKPKPVPHHSDKPKPAPAPAPHHSDKPKPVPHHSDGPKPAPHHSDKPKPAPHHSNGPKPKPVPHHSHKPKPKPVPYHPIVHPTPAPIPVPNSGTTGSGVPSSGTTGSGVPNSGMTGSGVPSSGMTGSGVPSSGTTGSGTTGAGQGPTINIHIQTIVNGFMRKLLTGSGTSSESNTTTGSGTTGSGTTGSDTMSRRRLRHA